jgi:hypothetical protein
MRHRLLVTACVGVVSLSGCEAASSCLGPAFKTYSSEKTGGALSPEDAASRYAATMRAPKAPQDGWTSADDASDGEVLVINGDWRFRTSRLTDDTWAVQSGERCDKQ